MNTLKISSLFFLLMTQTVFAEIPRWYSAQQLEQGKQVFKTNCAVCHGDKAQATKNWKQTNAAGQYPPPPLNGSAHAWHHSLDILRKSVNDGGQKIGGLMPSFETLLSSEERDSAIAFFQSQWTDELYKKWSTNFQVKPLLTQSDAVKQTSPVNLELLKSRLGVSAIDTPQSIANQQLYQVDINGRTIYLSKDGQFVLVGDIIDLKTGKKISER